MRATLRGCIRLVRMRTWRAFTIRRLQVRAGSPQSLSSMSDLSVHDSVCIQINALARDFMPLPCTVADLLHFLIFAARPPFIIALQGSGCSTLPFHQFSWQLKCSCEMWLNAEGCNDVPGMRKDMTGAAAQPAMVAQAQLLIAEQADVPSSSAVSLANQETLQPVSAAGETPAHIEHAEVCAVATSDSKDCGKKASSSGEEEEDSSRGESDDGDEIEGKPWSEREGLDPEAQKAARKAHKVVVKESNRERRKQKMKKHVKKRAINKHKHK